MKVVVTNEKPKAFYPFCRVCGWRKGGIDSWDGYRCKCKLSAMPQPIPPMDPRDFAETDAVEYWEPDEQEQESAADRDAPRCLG